MNKIEILKKFEFYNNSDLGTKQEIENESLFLKLEPGKRIFNEGDCCNQIALLGKGDIRIYKIGDTGREITLYHIRPGETCILSISSVLSEIPYPAYATVETETEIVVLDSVFFRNCINSNEKLRKFIFEILATRLSTVMHLIEEIVFNKLDKRLSEYLINEFNNKDINTINKTHEQISYDLGSAREVISRILKEFERNGAIQIQRGKITLIDRKILEDFK